MEFLTAMIRSPFRMTASGWKSIVLSEEEGVQFIAGAGISANETVCFLPVAAGTRDPDISPAIWSRIRRCQ